MNSQSPKEDWLLPCTYEILVYIRIATGGGFIF
jgi:hypothetical protein